MKLDNDIHVADWSELQDVLFKDTWDDKLKRYRSSYVYRGLSDSSYELKTTLMRLGGKYDQLEGHLMRNFRKYAQKREVPGNSHWNWLAVAQHHGLPTRLLDWTYSPYAALHFATANILQYNWDGVIWCVNYVEINKFLPRELQKLIREEGSNVFTADMLDGACGNIRELDQLQKEDFALFLEPPSLDDRIVNQHALFSMISNPKAILSDWLKQHPDLFFRIIIPADIKWEIRDKLDQANITERVFFPGLDGLSVWLKRHYSPKDISELDE